VNPPSLGQASQPSPVRHVCSARATSARAATPLWLSLLCCCWSEGHRTSWHGTDAPSASPCGAGSLPALVVPALQPGCWSLPGGHSRMLPSLRRGCARGHCYFWSLLGSPGVCGQRVSW